MSGSSSPTPTPPAREQQVRLGTATLRVEKRTRSWQSVWGCLRVSALLCDVVFLILVLMWLSLDWNRDPERFETRELKWAPDGKGMVLLDRETFCCAFEVEEDGQ